MVRVALVQHQSRGVLAAKVALRLMVLPTDRKARVLDCFAGDHDIWDIANEIATQPIDVLHNDADPSYRTQLTMTAVDALDSLDLEHFDLIDLDAWRPPVAELSVISTRQYRGVVAYTAIVNAKRPDGALMKEVSAPQEWRKAREPGGVDNATAAERWVAFLDTSRWPRGHIVQTWGRSGLHLYGVCGGYDQFDVDRYENLYHEALRSRRLAAVFRQ
jgi:hypothetical protein